VSPRKLLMATRKNPTLNLWLLKRRCPMMKMPSLAVMVTGILVKRPAPQTKTARRALASQNLNMKTVRSRCVVACLRLQI
jgi:hypothetical protein